VKVHVCHFIWPQDLLSAIILVIHSFIQFIVNANHMLFAVTTIKNVSTHSVYSLGKWCRLLQSAV